MLNQWDSAHAPNKKNLIGASPLLLFAAIPRIDPLTVLVRAPDAQWPLASRISVGSKFRPKLKGRRENPRRSLKNPRLQTNRAKNMLLSDREHFSESGNSRSLTAPVRRSPLELSLLCGKQLGVLQ
jgi:hypothetical protein